jgi:hypothetical protein
MASVIDGNLYNFRVPLDVFCPLKMSFFAGDKEKWEALEMDLLKIKSSLRRLWIMSLTSL